MRSSKQYTFAQIPDAQIPRSQFNRSHGYKTTFDAGYLIPVFMDEALPGDTFNLNMSFFARMSTPLFPVMDNLYLDSFFFAVPLRLIWSDFKKAMGEQANPGDSISYLAPVMTAPVSTGHLVGSLSDYLGIPTGVASLQHSSLWHRAYNLIWNEWFRDENLQNSVTVDTGAGPDTSSNYALLRRGKRHDYFTSCLPYPQKGNTAVSMPLGSYAPVVTDQTQFKMKGVSSLSVLGMSVVNTGPGFVYNSGTPTNGEAVLFESGLRADLSAATAATINDIRLAFQTQKLLERDARGGTRYTEIVRSHFGVVSPDARQQRPEYLGGGSTSINVHPVPQTTPSGIAGTTTKMGDLAAFATASGSRHGFKKSFTEHCVLLGLVSVRADLNYQQGLNRMFSRRSRYDFYWPAFAHIGEQAVLVKEIYAQNDSHDSEVFGYQERYAEYRYKPSVITGQFRSTYSTPLDGWHLAQKFTSLPTLNTTFIQENPPMTRVLAVSTAPYFIFDSHFDLKCARPMPMYSVPGLIDHF